MGNLQKNTEKVQSVSMLKHLAHHEARNVLQEEQWNFPLSTQLHEVRTLLSLEKVG